MRQESNCIMYRWLLSPLATWHKSYLYLIHTVVLLSIPLSCLVNQLAVPNRVRQKTEWFRVLNVLYVERMQSTKYSQSVERLDYCGSSGKSSITVVRIMRLSFRKCRLRTLQFDLCCRMVRARLRWGSNWLRFNVRSIDFLQHCSPSASFSLRVTECSVGHCAACNAMVKP